MGRTVRETDAKVQFARDGYTIKRNLFSVDETLLMVRALEQDPLIAKHSFYRADNEGQKTLAVQWNNPGNSTYGIGARMHRIVDVVEKLLDSEVYHWQSKVTAKEAKVGGAWEWHQDYGYWYNYGCLYPDMCSVMVALDRAAIANGCLKVLRGSHKIGRINHILDSGGQVNAERERVEWALGQHDEVNCELEPGDALFFHCNLLHSSGSNRSSDRRWALLYCYNSVSNKPFKESHNASYSKIKKVNDSRLLERGILFADGNEDFQSTYVKVLKSKS